MDLQRQKSSAAALSVLSNSLLVVLKLIVGLMIGSVSVISEAIHSGVDLLSALIAWFAVRTADKPADEEHAFGHGKVENISGTVEALLIFLAAGWIIYEAIEKLLGKSGPMQEAQWGIIVMLISSVANILVSRNLFKVGKATQSVALEADAWHLLTDVYTSAGVALGLAVIWLGKKFMPSVNLHWVDPITAIAVATLITKAAWELTLKSARDLLDARLPQEECEWISDRVRGLSPRVRGFHRLRTRKSGSHRFIQFHLMVDAGMSVEQSHDLHDEIVSIIKDHLGHSTVTIHIEPCSYNCTESCVHHCLIDSKQRKLGAESADV